MVDRHPMDSSSPLSPVKEGTVNEVEAPNMNVDVEDGGDGNTKFANSDLFTIICSAAAFLADGYQLQVMTMLNVLLREIYGKEVYDEETSTRVSNAALVGAVAGQLVVGCCCDYLGRKKAVVMTTSFIIIGTIIAAASAGPTPAVVFWVMTVARDMTGFGVGGEYPASSSSATEAANAYDLVNRGRNFVLSGGLPLTLGGPLATGLFAIFGLCFGMGAGEGNREGVWRTAFAFGAVVPATIFYFRIKIRNSKLYRTNAIKKVRQVPYRLVLRYYWRELVGTCGCWFLYDFISYPNVIFSGTIMKSLQAHGEGHVTTSPDILKTAGLQLGLQILNLPGVLGAAFLCNKFGRKNCMMTGFAGFIVFGLIVGLAFDQLRAHTGLFIFFYGMLLTSGKFGPGTMIGLMTSETYATGVRGTCYGLSAAVGKTGAAVGTQIFQTIKAHGDRWTFITAAGAGLAGLVLAYFFLVKLGAEDLMQRDEDFRRYLVDNGWGGDMGEGVLEAQASSAKKDEQTEAAKERVYRWR